MLRLKCGESVGVFSVAAAGGAKEVVGRREWKQPFSPENPKDSEGVWCCCWAGEAGPRLQLRTDSAAHPQLPPPTNGSCTIRLLADPMHRSLRLVLGTPPFLFPPSPAPKGLKCHWETSGNNLVTYIGHLKYTYEAEDEPQASSPARHNDPSDPGPSSISGFRCLPAL